MTSFTTRNFKIAVLAVLAAASSREVFGQLESPVSSSSLYERGVQAYFAGRSNAAERLLSQAIKADPDDPRSYYFRALSLMRLGRADYARGDMMIGANVEARAASRYRVGSALERIQGPNRLLLEQFRRQARLEITGRNVRAERIGRPNVEQAGYADAAVLRRRVLVPLERFSGSGELQIGPLRESTDGQPTAQTAGGDSPRSGEPATRPATENPFQDDVMKRGKSLPAIRGEGQPPTDTRPVPAPDARGSGFAPEAEEDPFRELEQDGRGHEPTEI